jgi:hypothetical protein
VREIGINSVMGVGRPLEEKVFFLGPVLVSGREKGAHATEEAIHEFIDYWEHQIQLAKDYLANGRNNKTYEWTSDAPRYRSRVCRGYVTANPDGSMSNVPVESVSKIMVNGREVLFANASLFYDDAVRLAQGNAHALHSVVYRLPGRGGRTGTLAPGESIEVLDGMVINSHVTSGT